MAREGYCSLCDRDGIKNMHLHDMRMHSARGKRWLKNQIKGVRRAMRERKTGRVEETETNGDGIDNSRRGGMIDQVREILATRPGEYFTSEEIANELIRRGSKAKMGSLRSYIAQQFRQNSRCGFKRTGTGKSMKYFLPTSGTTTALARRRKPEVVEAEIIDFTASRLSPEAQIFFLTEQLRISKLHQKRLAELTKVASEGMMQMVSVAIEPLE